MFSSRLFVGLIIPLVILGLGIWLFATADVNVGNVRVAGRLVSAPDIEFTVKECYVETGRAGRRNLVVELEADNKSSRYVEIDPYEFQVILVPAEDPLTTSTGNYTYPPLYAASCCKEVPGDMRTIPPGAVRRVTLRYWGENLPRGEDWKLYYLSLEYYDPDTPIILSKVINPEER